jgi:hypothetical protein
MYSSFSAPPSATTTEDGAFQIAAVNPDRYAVVVSNLPDGFYVKSIVAAGQDVLTNGLNVSAGAATPLEILLRPNPGQASGVVQSEQQQPAPNVTVVLIPQEPERRDQSQYYRSAPTDSTGRFLIRNLDPGQYKAYAWPAIEPGAWLDPDFLRPVESRGESVTITEGSQEDLRLKLIG